MNLFEMPHITVNGSDPVAIERAIHEISVRLTALYALYFGERVVNDAGAYVRNDDFAYATTPVDLETV